MRIRIQNSAVRSYRERGVVRGQRRARRQPVKLWLRALVKLQLAARKFAAYLWRQLIINEYQRPAHVTVLTRTPLSPHARACCVGRQGVGGVCGEP